MKKSLFGLLAIAAMGAIPAQASAQEVARGEYAVLTEDASRAYYEALVFCHQQLEIPIQVTYPTVRSALAANFATLGAEEQANLSQSPAILAYYRANWDALSLEDKLEFGEAVLGLAYGEQATAEVLAPYYPQRRAGRSADDIIGSIGLDVDADRASAIENNNDPDAQ